jgi:predicted RNase H-like nuclease (RuvC/YqgF family)
MIGKDDRSRLDQRVIVETYSEELTELSRSPSMVLVHKFGERQNAYNRNMETRMQAVQSVCRRFQGEINALQEENDTLRAELKLEKDRNRQLFEKMAKDMKNMQSVINTIRLYTDLNTNAIKRITDELENEEGSSSDGENTVK